MKEESVIEDARKSLEKDAHIAAVQEAKDLLKEKAALLVLITTINSKLEALDKGSPSTYKVDRSGYIINHRGDRIRIGE